MTGAGGHEFFSPMETFFTLDALRCARKVWVDRFDEELFPRLAFHVWDPMVQGHELLLLSAHASTNVSVCHSSFQPPPPCGGDPGLGRRAGPDGAGLGPVPRADQ